MTKVAANGIEIAYDEHGPTSGPAILLIMGLATQYIAWPEALCESLAGHGFRVIRFDNRDVGLSTKVENSRPVDLIQAFQRALRGEPVEAPYTLRDMAADALGLMDALGIRKAHMVGASMGGMIAQILAGEHAERTRSLVSIMSSSGDPGLPPARQEAIAAILAPRPSDRERAIAHAMNIYRVIGSPGFPTSDEELRARVSRSIDRSYYPAGIARQFVAVLASGSRVEMLKRIRVPTLVIHGADDPLVPVEAGKHTAATIPGAKLRIVDGMGHDLAAGLVPILADAIAEHCLQSDRVAASA